MPLTVATPAHITAGLPSVTPTKEISSSSANAAVTNAPAKVTTGSVQAATSDSAGQITRSTGKPTGIVEGAYPQPPTNNQQPTAGTPAVTSIPAQLIGSLQILTTTPAETQTTIKQIRTESVPAASSTPAPPTGLPTTPLKLLSTIQLVTTKQPTVIAASTNHLEVTTTKEAKSAATSVQPLTATSVANIPANSVPLTVATEKSLPSNTPTPQTTIAIQTNPSAASVVTNGVATTSITTSAAKETGPPQPYPLPSFVSNAVTPGLVTQVNVNSVSANPATTAAVVTASLPATESSKLKETPETKLVNVITQASTTPVVISNVLLSSAVPQAVTSETAATNKGTVTSQTIIEAKSQTAPTNIQTALQPQVTLNPGYGQTIAENKPATAIVLLLATSQQELQTQQTSNTNLKTAPTVIPTIQPNVQTSVSSLVPNAISNQPQTNAGNFFVPTVGNVPAIEVPKTVASVTTTVANPLPPTDAIIPVQSVTVVAPPVQTVAPTAATERLAVPTASQQKVPDSGLYNLFEISSTRSGPPSQITLNNLLSQTAVPTLPELIYPTFVTTSLPSVVQVIPPTVAPSVNLPYVLTPSPANPPIPVMPHFVLPPSGIEDLFAKKTTPTAPAAPQFPAQENPGPNIDTLFNQLSPPAPINPPASNIPSPWISYPNQYPQLAPPVNQGIVNPYGR